jgi:hypothetical protein
MRITAFKSILAAVVVTTGTLSGHLAKAETTLNVPFSFTVSGQTMPAGAYTVKEDTFHNVIVLRNQDSSKSFTYALRPGDATANQVHVALKFESSGESHTLRGIQFGTKMTSRLDDGPAPAGYEPARLSQGR